MDGFGPTKASQHLHTVFGKVNISFVAAFEGRPTPAINNMLSFPRCCACRGLQLNPSLQHAYYPGVWPPQTNGMPIIRHHCADSSRLPGPCAIHLDPQTRAPHQRIVTHVWFLIRHVAHLQYMLIKMSLRSLLSTMSQGTQIYRYCQVCAACNVESAVRLMEPYPFLGRCL